MNDLQVFDLVLFGGTGDLVTRKLLPALYSAYINNNIHPEARFFTIGRKDLTKEDYCKFAYDKAIAAKVSIKLEEWEKIL